VTSGLGALIAVGTAVAVLAVGTRAVADRTTSGVMLAAVVFLVLASFEAVIPRPAAT
jgi:hypothetical protein